MKTYSPTPAERRWCRKTIDQIADRLPIKYTTEAQRILQEQGIEVSKRYITDCMNLYRHDINVVRVLEHLSQQ